MTDFKCLPEKLVLQTKVPEDWTRIETLSVIDAHIAGDLDLDHGQINDLLRAARLHIIRSFGRANPMFSMDGVTDQEFNKALDKQTSNVVSIPCPVVLVEDLGDDE